MKYTFAQIATFCKATIYGNPQAEIEQISTDSRSTISTLNSLFIAISGKNHDAHNFIPELIKKGYQNFIVEKKHEIPKEFIGINFIKVENSVLALQQIAAQHRLKFQQPILAITGSNGKTVVKEWLYQILQNNYKICRSPKSYNSQIGVPLSTLLLEKFHELAIIEAGISQPGEMAALQEIIQADYGIFTNVGDAHQENFQSISQKVEEKFILFKNCKKVIICSDYVEIENIARKTLSSDNIFTWSVKTKADLQIIKIQKNKESTQIKALYRNKKIEINLPFTDNASIENICNIWCFLIILGLDNAQIKQQISELKPVAMRLEMIAGRNNCILINDSYSADIQSLNIALDFMNQQNFYDKKSVILSDFHESGIEDGELYTKIANILIQNKIYRLIGVGSNLQKHKALFCEIAETIFFPGTQEVMSYFESFSFQNETILLKGARKFGFENLAKKLQQKTHKTVLEINLTAMKDNLNYFRSYLHAGTKIMVMVKAFSYGSGSYEVASLLQHQRVDYLGVAFTDEGVDLRKAGISLPIIVMNCEESSFENLLEYKLEPEIYNFRLLKEYTTFLKNKKIENSPIHLKFDTGMKRHGFEKNDISELINFLKTDKSVKISSIFSHLVGSDEETHNGFSLKQIDLFKEMSDSILKNFDYPIIRHILNSAGIERFPQFQFEMVRLGIGLYGISPINPHKVRNISTLKTYISQIRNVEASETVGYSRKGKLTQNSVIATLPIGYADGLNRLLGNRKLYVLINDQPAYYVGNICMDICMVDITGIEAQEGDEAIIFGEKPSINEMANALATIPYEVMTSVSQRVKKIYIQE